MSPVIDLSALGLLLVGMAAMLVIPAAVIASGVARLSQEASSRAPVFLGLHGAGPRPFARKGAQHG